MIHNGRLHLRAIVPIFHISDGRDGVARLTILHIPSDDLRDHGLRHFHLLLVDSTSCVTYSPFDLESMSRPLRFGNVSIWWGVGPEPPRYAVTVEQPSQNPDARMFHLHLGDHPVTISNPTGSVIINELVGGQYVTIASIMMPIAPARGNPIEVHEQPLEPNRRGNPIEVQEHPIDPDRYGDPTEVQEHQIDIDFSHPVSFSLGRNGEIGLQFMRHDDGPLTPHGEPIGGSPIIDQRAMDAVRRADR